MAQLADIFGEMINHPFDRLEYLCNFHGYKQSIGSLSDRCPVSDFLDGETTTGKDEEPLLFF